MMPKLNGFEVLDAIDADPALKDLPVVVLTARYLSSGDKAKLQKRVEGIVQKGETDIHEIVAILNEHSVSFRSLSALTVLITRPAWPSSHRFIIMAPDETPHFSPPRRPARSLAIMHPGPSLLARAGFLGPDRRPPRRGSFFCPERVSDYALTSPGSAENR